MLNAPSFIGETSAVTGSPLYTKLFSEEELSVTLKSDLSVSLAAIYTVCTKSSVHELKFVPSLTLTYILYVPASVGGTFVFVPIAFTSS